VLGRRDEVEDVVHDTFLAAHRGLKTLRHPSEARTWLTTVALRIARRRLRLRKVRGWVGFDDVADDAQVADPSASAHDRALLAAVYRALDALSVEERLAWSLRYLQGERVEEVAALCGCSLATAKRRIASAQISLQEVLGDG
jgi:RNA polymerase sigma-70 factor (ECF subfamily)